MIKKSGKQGRIRWKCRRGMLELDEVLMSFLDRHFADLSEKQKIVFERLLEEQDPILQSWLIERVVPEDKEFAFMVGYIRSKNINRP